MSRTVPARIHAFIDCANCAGILYRRVASHGLVRVWTAYCFEYERGLGHNLPKCDRFNGEIAPRGVCSGEHR